MSLVIQHDFLHPPPTWRGPEGSQKIYGKENGRLLKMPPVWTVRGHFEAIGAWTMAQHYDDGVFVEPKPGPELEAWRAEFNRTYGLLANGVVGVRKEVDGAIIMTYIASHPHFDGMGCVSRYLDILPRRQTVIFPEVLPESKMPGMLERRGFKLAWVADTDDELLIFFPCHVRMAR